MDMPAVLLAELSQPYIGVLCDQDGVRHPCGIRTEFLVLVCGIPEYRNLRLADNGGPLLGSALAPAACGFLGGSASTRRVRIELHPYGKLFFMQNLTGHR